MDVLGGLAVMLALAVFVLLRWRHVMRRRLSDEDLGRIGDELLREWRGHAAADIGSPFRVSAEDWRSCGLSDLEAVEVTRYLMGRGKVVAPGFDVLSMLNGRPPTSVALTRSSWEEHAPDAARYEFHGPTTFNGPTQVGEGGIQQNAGEFTYTTRAEVAAGLDRLALAIFHVADQADLTHAAPLESMADVVSRAADSGQTDSPRLRATLRWLSDRANDVTGELVAAGIVAMAGSLLAAI